MSILDNLKNEEVIEKVEAEIVPQEEIKYTHKLTKHILDSVEDWTSNGLPKRNIATAIGVLPTTLNKWLRRGLENVQDYEDGEVAYMDLYGQFYINYHMGLNKFEETQLGMIDASKDYKAHIWRLQQAFKGEEHDNYKEETKIVVENKYSEYTSDQLKSEVLKKLGIITHQDENPLNL